jgi:hypothetical protein
MKLVDLRVPNNVDMGALISNYMHFLSARIKLASGFTCRFRSSIKVHLSR